MNDLLSSRLYDDRNFYKSFVKDLKGARKTVLIESPFITSKRTENLMPILSRLRRRGVHVVVNTRDPEEHDAEYKYQAYLAVFDMQQIGITVLYTGKHHRKLAVIDKQIIWEGRPTIVSQDLSSYGLPLVHTE